MQIKFDSMIKAAVREHLPVSFDWRWIKAQLIVASNLNETMRSSVGAIGIAQFMPDRWQIIKDDMGLPGYADCNKAEWAIPGLCFFMNLLWTDWTAEWQWIDRYCLTLASYDCGLVHIMNALHDSGGATDYATIITQLPKVTDSSNAKTTQDYVRNVLKVWIALVLDKKV